MPKGLGPKKAFSKLCYCGKIHVFTYSLLCFEIHDVLLFICIDFKCYSNEHCNSHGSCNNETGRCACDTKWKDAEDCSGNLLMQLSI